MRQVLPVIHQLTADLTLREAEIAFAAGADGVFLISHTGDDASLLVPAGQLKQQYADKQIGVNMLSMPALTALQVAHEHQLDMVWTDRPGITSAGADAEGEQVVAWLREHRDGPLFFGSVAFKYQPVDPDPAMAALYATLAGMIPTTSGPGTGEPPSNLKAVQMAAPLEGKPLAVASGMTPENVAEFLPYFTHYLVATGVSRDFHHFDPERLAAFVAKVKSA